MLKNRSQKVSLWYKSVSRAVLDCCLLWLLFPLTAAAEISPARQNELLHLLYQDCGSCHGMTLKGGLGPSILPADLSKQDVATITATILNGRPGTAMPPWAAILKEEEARWLAEQLRAGTSRNE